MKQIKRITLQLSMENAKDKKIADFLSEIDKEKYRTVNNAIKTILYAFINGAASENAKNSDMREIISVIKETLESELPKLFATFSQGSGNISEPIARPADTQGDSIYFLLEVYIVKPFLSQI